VGQARQHSLEKTYIFLLATVGSTVKQKVFLGGKASSEKMLDAVSPWPSSKHEFGKG
jgi:hypothetical protein